MVSGLSIDLKAKIAIYEQTRRNGVEFLLSTISPDGSVADAGRPRFGYYRVPWALAVSGETSAAHRVLDWVERDWRRRVDSRAQAGQHAVKNIPKTI